MKPSPPKLTEKIVATLIPEPCREVVLGDLHERFTNGRRYIADAAAVVPLVIVSRIRRTSDPETLLIEALSMYLSYLAAASYVDRTFLSQEWSLIRLTIPPALSLLLFVMADAYAFAASPTKSILYTAIGAGLGLAIRVAPFWAVILGCAMSALLVSAVRLMFPNIRFRKRK